MFSYEKRVLSNGLRVIHHEDKNTPLAVVNVLYNVGARDEREDLTGMAHLFEHLMFSGSQNASSYDEPLQKASGENNAFTSNDITNYYVTLPAENVETALWLESDRMRFLDLNEESMRVQQNVVIEEFKQRYLNQPYGDLWLLLRPLSYKSHPYKWATIGKELSHIEKVVLEDLKQFYNRFYNPSNAILVIAGNISSNRAFDLAEKWFGNLPAGFINQNHYPQEPVQTEARKETVYRNVPMSSLSIAFHTVKRSHPDFYATDLLSDILGGSASSRLQLELVKKKQLFADIGAYVTESLDEGQIIINGRLLPGISMEEAEKSVWDVLHSVYVNPVSESEWQKVVNKKLTALKYGELEVLNKAMNLAMFENISGADLLFQQESLFQSTRPEQIIQLARELFQVKNSSTLHYLSNPA